MHWLDTVSRYANLLQIALSLVLVVVTIVYVVINGLTLRAFRHASLSERRLRHLEDIKHAIVTPLLTWIDHEVSHSLRGHEAPALLGIFVLPPEPPRFQAAVCSPGVFEDSLFDDALGRHFAKELTVVVEFRERLAGVLRDIVSFASDAESAIAAECPVPRSSVFGGNPGAFADTHSFVKALLPSLLAGQKPTLRMESTPGGGLEIYEYSTCIARGEAVSLRPWIDSRVTLVQRRWGEQKLTDSVHGVQGKLREARDLLMRIGRMQMLPGECDYVGKPD